MRDRFDSGEKAEENYDTSAFERENHARQRVVHSTERRQQVISREPQDGRDWKCDGDFGARSFAGGEGLPLR
jgi:hypothetical protein